MIYTDGMGRKRGKERLEVVTGTYKSLQLLRYTAIMTKKKAMDLNTICSVCHFKTTVHNY